MSSAAVVVGALKVKYYVYDHKGVLIQGKHAVVRTSFALPCSFMPPISMRVSSSPLRANSFHYEQIHVPFWKDSFEVVFYN